ncbi:MAG TPA: hypothetical protein VMX17_15315 [Candidatus Glassbacteria bacterium]|nr:hypothetical protein [Candidatus Glassbacteria bacterium]
MNDLKILSKGMFAPSMPSNPIPFANGLIEGCKQNGTDWIRTDEAKMILFTIIQQSYGQAVLLDSFREYQRLFQVAYHNKK